MLDFLNMDADVETVEEKDSLGGSRVKPSGAYPLVLKYAYMDESKPNAATGNPGGAHNVNFVFKDGDNELKFTIYVTSGKAKGQTPFYVKDNKKFPLPGFSQVDNFCKQFTDNPLNKQPTVEKTLELWNGTGTEKVKRKVLSDLVNVKMIVGLILLKENKHNDKSVIVEKNEIDKFFNEDGLTSQEVAKGETEPKFLEKWKKSREDYVKDKSTKVEGGAGAPAGNGGGAATGNAGVDNLFAGVGE